MLVIKARSTPVHWHDRKKYGTKWHLTYVNEIVQFCWSFVMFCVQCLNVALAVAWFLANFKPLFVPWSKPGGKLFKTMVDIPPVCSPGACPGGLGRDVKMVRSAGQKNDRSAERCCKNRLERGALNRKLSPGSKHCFGTLILLYQVTLFIRNSVGAAIFWTKSWSAKRMGMLTGKLTGAWSVG